MQTVWIEKYGKAAFNICGFDGFEPVIFVTSVLSNRRLLRYLKKVIFHMN